MAKKKISRKKGLKKVLQVHSPRSGLVHQIGDMDGFEQVAEQILQKFAVDNQLQLAQSLKFFEAVDQWSLDKKFLLELTIPEIYRICFGGLDPLSIAGSLAVGGRFNIGGAQKTEQFSFEMYAAIYAGSSVECSKAETGPHKNPEIYELKAQRKMHFWNVRELLSSQENSTALFEVIDKTPFNMQWALQKFPTPSQILSAKLKAIGGDGIMYPSTKFSGGTVYGFFIKDERDARTKLTANRITDVQIELPVSCQS